MEPIRRPFQGVLNIIRFNWQYYITVIFICCLFLALRYNVLAPYITIFSLMIIMILCVTIVSLLVSYYVYDLTDLYELNWLDTCNQRSIIVNINAGFDEISNLLRKKFINSDLIVLDFYDPNLHTEISIQRARNLYAPIPNTINTTTTKLPLTTNSTDYVFLFFAAHEIRDEAERILFFKEIKRILKNDGKIFITEHIRDLPNFLAYNIGFFHFHSRKSWIKVFNVSELTLLNEARLNPFVINFTLTKYGISS